MALFYDLTFRGTIGALNWAVVTHWRVNALGVHTELQACQTLTLMGYDFWDTAGKAIVSANVVLTKLVGVAFDEPLGFYEQSAAIIGTLSGDPCPPFVAKGFRQFRSNADFRTSTHRFPEVREVNNTAGSWAYDIDIEAADIAAVSAWLGEPHVVDVPDEITTLSFYPVLLRRQYTVVDPVTEVKTVTYLDPPEISDVADAAFYGVTSQVSRKYILPT